MEEVLTPDEREVIGTLVNKQQLLPPQERGRAPMAFTWDERQSRRQGGE